MPPTKRPRLDPVSCQLCRSKKLRCSRQNPCSNCSARGARCIYAADPPPQYRSPQPDDPTVNARLKRLEEAVEGLRKSALPPLTPASVDSPAAALNWLEGSGLKATNQYVRASDHTGALSFTVVQIEGSNEALPSHSFLPTLSETLRLFAHYNEQVGYLHHIIHTATTLATIHQIYADLPDRMNPSSAALLLSMLASSSHFWDPTVGIFSSAPQARRVSLCWLADALKTLDASRSTNPPGVADVQATIIASYLAYNTQGYSTQFRLLQTTALELARQAELHKTDAPPAPTTTPAQPRDVIADEVKRRVWWHIVATDWILAFTAGPQEGTYLVSPHHMRVSHPLNANDDDTTTSSSSSLSSSSSSSSSPSPVFTPRPLSGSAPTTMSFALHRLRFATVCRAVADAATATAAGGGEGGGGGGSFPLDLRRVAPRTVRRLDGLWEEFLEGLPVVFGGPAGGAAGDGGGDADDEGLRRRFPRLETQRCLIQLCAHVRRCRLHQPWLVEGRKEADGGWDRERGEQAAFSRRVCLQSAKRVVGAARRFERDEEGRYGGGEGRLSTVVHHVAMAAVVLVVDLCFSGLAEGPAREREQRRGEIGEACRMLERARRESEMAARFLKSLGEMLTRHGMDLRLSADDRSVEASEAQEADAASGGGDVEFEALLQSCANVSGELDMSGWEDLFTSFNSYPQFIDLAV
ncbi:uncharacterized protein BKCO1_6800030 [Diplodia corticola]|uniref:Zn(2)-C6 fungal-type domain-containing protein n=1 Tax=Diplodia corticola TaxID=236234 RepID=A0A1J9RQ23_9PEZI|nr:uncharacterized protein BKCO1_6800030 [Diplodia corticola]OJD30012.1 hypothetical protein BKCO1_6800030 [Diplodia corticola]